MTKDAELNKLIWENRENFEKAIPLIKAMGKADLELVAAKAAFTTFITPLIERRIGKGVDIKKVLRTVD